jgi:hypothetical protein
MRAMGPERPVIMLQNGPNRVHQSKISSFELVRQIECVEYDEI